MLMLEVMFVNLRRNADRIPCAPQLLTQEQPELGMTLSDSETTTFEPRPQLPT